MGKPNKTPKANGPRFSIEPWKNRKGKKTWAIGEMRDGVFVPAIAGLDEEQAKAMLGKANAHRR